MPFRGLLVFKTRTLPLRFTLPFLVAIIGLEPMVVPVSGGCFASKLHRYVVPLVRFELTLYTF